MEILNKLRLKSEVIFFGPGVRELLFEIERTRSIKKATEAMSLSYNKALRMIRVAEEETGFDFVESKRGGTDRGGSFLTPKGREFLQAYQEFENLVDDYSRQLFEQNLMKFLPDQ